MKKPNHYFKHISEAYDDIENQPEEIEFLKMWTGETFIHTGGTVYWDQPNEGRGGLNIESLNNSGITHYRVIK